MRWNRSWFAPVLALLVVAAGEARAFVALEYLEVGDELPAGSLHGDWIRLAASPDGRHLYATGDQADSLLLFSIHPYAGTLTLEESYEGGFGTPFDGATDVLVTADGGHVIVGQRGASGVSVLARDASDGTLAVVDQQRDGVAGVTGLSLPERMALDPGERHLYVLTTDSVVVFAVEADGTLEFVEDESAGFTDPFFDDVLPNLAVSRDGKHVYASSPDDGHVIVYARNATTGALTFVETEDAGGTLAPSAVAVSPDGDHVYVATSPDCDSSGIAIFDRDAGTGQLAHASTMVVEHHCFPTPRIAFREGELCFSRIGQAVSPTSNLLCYQRDAGTGALSRVLFGSGSLGSGFSEAISDFVFAGPYAYGVEPVSFATDEPAVSAKAYPAILPLETQQDGFDGVTGLDGAGASVVSPDGRHVYVASRFDGAVQIFERGGGTGALEAAGEVRQGIGGVTSLSTPTDLAISPDGKHLYVTASGSDALTVFSRDAASGALTLVEVESDGQNGVSLFQAPSGVTVSPDGRFVLATSAGEDAVVSFARNAATGALAFAGDFSGFLDAASDVTVSPDGRHVYVTAETDGNLTGLSLGADGALTFFERLNDLGAVDGLTGARDLVVSRDGKHIYVAGTADPRVAVFARDAGNGTFTFVEALDATPGGATPSLGGGDGVAISPDGAFVYAGDVHSNTQDVRRLMIYRRDPATGRLYHAGFDQGNTDAITVSPDGRNLYVAQFTSGRLAVFVPEPAPAAAVGAVATALATCSRRRRLCLRRTQRRPVAGRASG
jgi:6-phosphogluconolactonase (cycloisomerase 2 family)